MDKIKILILDDEASACNILQILISKHLKFPHQIEVYTSPEKCLKILDQYRPTLLFLDIEMPSINGFDFLNAATFWDYDVIFTTAYDHYAIKAIRFSALDYLLKPIDQVELQNALNRHIVRNQTRDGESVALVNNLIENLKRTNIEDFKLALSSTFGTEFIAPSNVIRCEGDNNYTRFFFNDRKPMLVSRTLKEYDELLIDHGFLRIHKSHLINRHFVQRIDREGLIWMSDGSHVPISRRNKDRIKEILKKG